VRCEINLADPLTKGLTRQIVLETLRGMGLKAVDWDNMLDTHLWSTKPYWSQYALYLHPLAYSSASERLSSYTLNGSIAHWGGATEMHLMDSPLDMCEVEQSLDLNISIL